MKSPEIKSEQNKDVEYVNSKKLSCAGVEGPLGHPKVYLDMGDDNPVSYTHLTLPTIYSV